MKSKPEDEILELRKGCVDAIELLDRAAKELQKILNEQQIVWETPIEAEAVMQSTAIAVEQAIRCLKKVNGVGKSNTKPRTGGPTHQQGQFLAFIHEFIMRNEAGRAPSHAELQRFFNLTPPSVNSMLIRLESNGFIRREPGKARRIEIVIDATLIPPLDRPFKFPR